MRDPDFRCSDHSLDALRLMSSCVAAWSGLGTPLRSRHTRSSWMTTLCILSSPGDSFRAFRRKYAVRAMELESLLARLTASRTRLTFQEVPGWFQVLFFFLLFNPHKNGRLFFFGILAPIGTSWHLSSLAPRTFWPPAPRLLGGRGQPNQTTAARYPCSLRQAVLTASKLGDPEGRLRTSLRDPSQPPVERIRWTSDLPGPPGRWRLDRSEAAATDRDRGGRGFWGAGSLAEDYRCRPRPTQQWRTELEQKWG